MATLTAAPRKTHRYVTPTAPGSVTARVIGGAVIAVAFLLPYLVMLLGSFKSLAEVLRTPPTFVPEEWHLDNYVTMWSVTETPLPDNLVSSLVISICATVLTLIVAVPAAYYTAKFKFPGRLAFLFLVLMTQMLQPAVVVVGLFKEFQALSLNGTWWAMILVNSAFNLSFGTWILHSFFASIPKEVDESARLDGASNWQILWRIDMPLVWPGVVTATIFTFTAAWNEFAASLVILSSSPAKQPLTVALTMFKGQYQTRWQYVFAVSVLAIVPAVALFAAIEKKLVAGLTAGSIK
jgi:multiple sugar transport system permease protein